MITNSSTINTQVLNTKLNIYIIQILKILPLKFSHSQSPSFIFYTIAIFHHFILPLSHFLPKQLFFLLHTNSSSFQIAYLLPFCFHKSPFNNYLFLNKLIVFLDYHPQLDFTYSHICLTLLASYHSDNYFQVP